MSRNIKSSQGLAKAWCWLVAAWLLLPADLPAQVLDNNKLRFGTGFEASVSQDGNLQQPFYYNAVKRAWRKLTFYAYPLETAIGVGGDKTSGWNTNGTIVQHPALSGQVLDTSGFVVSNLANGRGSGTIVSTGTMQIGSQLLEVENTYTLPANSAFIKISTRLKNVGAGLAENVRMWVGTRDDWVGTTDVPLKQKGDLVNGQFVPATSGASPASALQISSKEEGVFFYTDSPKANTIIQNCCNFSNIINQDPRTSPTDVTGDASYGFFVRLNDLEPGASEAFTWYYAAGEISLMPEILVDVAAAIGGIRNISYTTATLQATATAAATGYWMVVPRQATPPTAAQLKAGTSYGPEMAASGSGPMAAGEPSNFAISNLSPGTAYKLYFVAEAAAGDFSAVRQVPFTTLALSLPALSTVAPTSITATGALAGGLVDKDGGAAVTARGVCWSTAGYPTVASSKTADGTGTGAFTSSLHNLAPNTTYYVRAYATNAQGTAYGKTFYLKTSPVAPSLTLSANDICVGSTTKISAAGVQETLYWYADSCGGSSLGTGNSLTVSPAITTTYFARNYNGTYSDCARVTVRVNNEPPVVAGRNITLNLGADRSASLSPGDVDQGSRDACGPVTLAITAGKTAFTCADLGQTYPVALTATDQQGHTATVTVQVTVADAQSYCNQAPVAVAKALTLAAGAGCQAAVAPAALDGGSTDADGDPLTFSLYPAGPFKTGTTPVTLTVTDPAGASSSAAATVTVTDTEAPVVAVKNLSLALDGTGQALITGDQVNDGSTDNCGIAAMVLDRTVFGCADIGENEVVLTVTDIHGNVATAKAMVQVIGEVPVSAIQVWQQQPQQDHCGHHGHQHHPEHSRCGHQKHEDKAHHQSCRHHPALAGSGRPLDHNRIYLGYGPQSVVLDATGGEEEPNSYFWTGNGTLSSTTSGMPVFIPEAAGVYTFTVVETNAYGCSASSSVTITVVDVRCGNKNDKVSICHKGQQICVAPEAVAAHLAHGDQVGPCANPALANARMAREVEYAQVLGLTAYPNPVRERTTIEFSMVSASSYRLAIFDMKGAMIRKIAAGQAEPNQFFSFEFNVRTLPAGVYLIRLGTDQQVATKKLVIEK